MPCGLHAHNCGMSMLVVGFVNPLDWKNECAFCNIFAVGIHVDQCSNVAVDSQLCTNNGAGAMLINLAAPTCASQLEGGIVGRGQSMTFCGQIRRMWLQSMAMGCATWLWHIACRCTFDSQEPQSKTMAFCPHQSQKYRNCTASSSPHFACR